MISLKLGSTSQYASSASTASPCVCSQMTIEAYSWVGCPLVFFERSPVEKSVGDSISAKDPFSETWEGRFVMAKHLFLNVLYRLDRSDFTFVAARSPSYDTSRVLVKRGNEKLNRH